MSLLTEVQSRVPSQTLLELTRQKDPSATTVDTTLLGVACDDIEAEFVTYAGESFSTSIRRHVVLGVQGVLAMLRSWVAAYPDGVEKDLGQWRESVRDYARTAARDRLSPETNSVVGTKVNGVTLRDPFDHEEFDDYQPGFVPEREAT